MCVCVWAGECSRVGDNQGMAQNRRIEGRARETEME